MIKLILFGWVLTILSFVGMYLGYGRYTKKAREKARLRDLIAEVAWKMHVV